MKRVVVFDFDGTLADSIFGVLALFERYHNHNIPSTSDGVKDFRNKSMFQIAKELKIPLYKLFLLALFGRRQFSKHLDVVQLYAGIEDVLKSLHKAGVKMYILSTNSADTIKRFLNTKKVDKYIENIYGKAFILNKAPKMRQLMRQEGVRREDLWFVGDELVDVFSAKRAGVDLVSVTWGYTARTALAAAKPTAITDTTAELLSILQPKTKGVEQ